MKKVDIKLRTLFVVLCTMAVLSTSIGGYLYYSALSKSSEESAHKEAEDRVRDLGDDIDSYLSWSLLSVKTLAALKDLKQTLVNEDVISLAKANTILDIFRKNLKVSVCYLLDRSGKTIASSNHDTPDSFMNKNYGFRPYFKQSIKGMPAVYMALGVTSKRRGIYFSYPVYGKGKEPLGVVVIKTSVEMIEKDFIKAFDGVVVLTNPQNVVFVSNRSNWLFHMLWSASSKTISNINKSRQFGTGPWNWTGMELLDEDSAMDNLGNKYRLHLKNLVNYPGWHVVYFHSHHEIKERIIAPIRKYVGVGVLVLCIFLGAIISFLFIKANSDIIQRKKVEEELQERESFIRTIMDNLPIGVAVNSVDSTIKFDYMNNNFPKFYRTTREALADPNEFWNCVYEDSGFREEIKKKILDDCASGDPERMNWEDIPITRKGKETSFISAKNIPIPDKQLMISVVWSVTERKLAETALDESELLFSQMFAQSVTSTCLYNPSGTIAKVNHEFCKMFGVDENAILSSGYNAFEDQATIDAGIIPFLKNIFDKKKPNNWEIDFDIDKASESTGTPSSKSGKVFLEVFGYPILNQKGNLECVVLQHYDITERKQLDESIRQTQKMESIGSLAGGIAHDFNNLLFPIICMSEILLEDLPQDSLEHGNAQVILNAGIRAGDLVKQILAFSRQSEHILQPVRIQNILKEVLKLSRSTIPSNIKIKENIDTNCGLIMADATQIHQVAMNLITNAFHAIEEKNGIIDVTLKQIELKNGEIPNSLLKTGLYIQLSVADNGGGMTQSVQKKIFDPYFTTKEIGKGTGLGLAVVYGIIKEHKGDITVSSEEGKGSTFNVYLPLMKTNIIPVLDNQSLKLPTGTENILLVDDEISVAKLEGQILSRLGYNITEQTNSFVALNEFKTNPEKFDLVISDMAMPNMTGDQLAREILSIRPDMPIIICTGFSERVNKEQAEIIGVKGFLMKPFIINDIAQMVRNVLDKAKNS
jgi:C4-dicarboxylate-specific signal transduction histidine kinase/CheY-like chemotaxis protein